MANINPTSHTQHQYPSRIKSFCRQNQNSLRRLILVPLLYISLAICYIYGLLFHNVSTSKMYLDNEGSISDAPTDAELEPQSLSHVALSNAEVLWKKRVKREEYLKRRAQMKKDMELQKKSVAELQKKRLNQTSNGMKGGDEVASMFDETKRNLANSTNVNQGVGFKTGTTPKRRISRGKGVSPPTNNQDVALPFILLITFCTLFRLCFSLAIQRISDDIDEEDEQQQAADGGIFWTRRQLRRRARAQIRQRQFQNFVNRLNAQRVENGERPIGAESLRLVISDRDFNGNDYERLWQFHEENGPAIGSLLSSIGATEAEIGRCPSRVLGEGDDLVRGNGGATAVRGTDGHACSVCLESYRVGDEVRTIPCFHTVSRDAFFSGCW
jgi:hypothetical protein